MFTRLNPIAFFFVILYGSGFIGAKYGMLHAEPLTFLSLRFFLASLCVALLAKLFSSPWPRSFAAFAHISIAGLLSIALFSIGVFVAISLGLSPALCALIIALQPLIVAIFAQALLKERLNTQHYLGLLLALLGVVLLIWQKLSFSINSSLALSMAFLALLGLSFGNLYQKHFCSDMSLFAGGSIQSGVSFVLCFFLALLFENMHITPHIELVASLAYMSFGVSVGALSLLYLLIAQKEISKVATLFYFMPLLAALLSFLLFNEHFSSLELFAICLSAYGIYLSNKA